MRYRAALVIIIVLLIGFPVSAAELKVEGTFGVYQNTELSDGEGLKASLGTQVYCWASWEKTLLRFGGQEMAQIAVWGGGVGTMRKGWFLEVGYYVPKPRFQPSVKEALWLEMNDVLHGSYAPAGYHNNDFEYEINGGLGVALGGKWKLHRRFFLSAMYRWLKLEDVITCRFDETAFWEIYEHRDFSNMMIGLGFKF